MIALDLFAGTGWGVAAQRLGIEEYGVEIMPEAIATREANGMTTVYHDVWEGLEEPRPHSLNDEEKAERRRVSAKVARGEILTDYELLIASPPCQSFSMAGGGAGRRAIDEVVGLIDSKAYRDVATLRAFGEKHDPRTALVLTPLAHVYRDVPTFVVFEQVPPVLPVWERCADEMRRWGYSVWTGVLNAEQYGVPQTRKRAILIARADGIEAAPPTPTHSKYYPTDPSRLDPDVKPWVSMSTALGWGMTARPYPSVASGTEAGGTDPAALGGSGARKIVTRERSAGRWVLGDDWHEGHRILNLDPSKPATTVAADPRLSSREHHYHGEQNSTSTRVTIEEAATLQSFPPGFTFAGKRGKQFLQVGNAVPPLLAEAILKGFLE